MKASTTFFSALLIGSAAAFCPSKSTLRTTFTNLDVISSEKSFDPLHLADESPSPAYEKKHLTGIVAAASAAVVLHPLAAFAEEVDDYEYGAVDAPIGLAWGAGVLAVLTALLPIALQGGEEAFEVMREQDSNTWGKNKDVLSKKK